MKETWLILLLAWLVCSLTLPREAHGQVTVSLSVAPKLHAWQRATASVNVRNQGPMPVLLLLVEVKTATGPLERWGLLGNTIRWAHHARGNRTSTGYQVLVKEPAPQQRVSIRPSSSPPTSEDLLRIEPLTPGGEIALQTGFDAAYQHGTRAEALVVYLRLDATVFTCEVVREPATTGFANCSRVKIRGAPSGAGLYLPARETDKKRRQASAAAPLVIEHPAFDIERARALSRVRSGPFGLDTHRGRWILFDEKSRNTLLVGRRGTELRLAGDWVKRLVEQNSMDGTSLFWQCNDEATARRIMDRLARAGIGASVFSFKGHASPTRLVLTLMRDDRQLRALASILTAERARLTGGTITSAP